jgi:hypothetical protein
MPLDVLDDPFASSSSVSITEDSLRDASPSMPDTKVQDLLRAADNESFDKQEGVNEKFLLDKELTSIASNISAELGPFALDSYASAQDIVSAGVLRVLNEGDRTGSFRGENARGGSQWDVQQLTVESLNDTSSQPDPEQFRTYNTGGSGKFNIAPAILPGGGEDRDPSAGVGSNGDGTHSLDEETQAAFILGMYQSTNPRVVEQAVIDVDDGEDRSAFDVYGHSNLGTLQAFDTPSLEYITDDDSFDINGSATQGATTDLYPYGVNFNTAQRLPGLNTQV